MNSALSSRAAHYRDNTSMSHAVPLTHTLYPRPANSPIPTTMYRTSQPPARLSQLGPSVAKVPNSCRIRNVNLQQTPDVRSPPGMFNY